MRLGLIGLSTGLAALLYLSRPETTAPLYQLSAYPVLGMLLADLLALLAVHGLALPSVELAGQIGVLILAAFLRLGWAIPLSGHALLFAYLVLRRLLVRFPRQPLFWAEFAMAAGLYLVVGYLKVFLWSDALTFATGSAAAVPLAAISFAVSRRLAHR